MLRDRQSHWLRPKQLSKQRASLLILLPAPLRHPLPASLGATLRAKLPWQLHARLREKQRVTLQAELLGEQRPEQPGWELRG